jgi:hypothetical protein
MWYADGCLTGLETEMEYKGGYKSAVQTYGKAKGEEKSLSLGWEEAIIGAVIKGGR